MNVDRCGDPSCPNKAEVERLERENAELRQRIQKLEELLENKSVPTLSKLLRLRDDK